MIGVIGSIVVGALLAVAVAVALSPLDAHRTGEGRCPALRRRFRLDGARRRIRGTGCRLELRSRSRSRTATRRTDSRGEGS